MPPSTIHLDRLRLRHLRLLSMIENHKSLRAVGQSLNLTQPAVSQMVKDLEFALGVQLVDRSVRGVSLTEAGRVALHRTKPSLATIDHLKAELVEEPCTILRVGTNPTLMSRMLLQVLEEVTLRSVDLHFNIRSGLSIEMMENLWNGNIDCYVGRVDWDEIPRGMTPALRHTPLVSTELVLACSIDHPLAQMAALKASDLEDLNWALPPANSNNRISLEHWMRNKGLYAPKVTFEIAADPNALLALASRLNLITCVPKMAVTSHPDRAGLKVLNVEDFSLPSIEVGFVSLTENDELPQVTQLKQALITFCQTWNESS